MENRKDISTHALMEGPQPDIRDMSGKMGFNGNNRILIVDDEDSIRKILSMELESMGYAVSTARNGFEALGMLTANSFGIVITDLNMPGMDGFILSHKIKEKSPETAIIMVTGDEQNSVMKKLNEKYADHIDYLLFKPFSLEELDTVIDMIISEVHREGLDVKFLVS